VIIALVSASRDLISLPKIRGALLIAHRAKCVFSSIFVNPVPSELTTPISNISGSFHAPIPAEEASPLFEIMLLLTDPNEALISPVVLHEFPIAGAHVAVLSSPQLQMEKKIGLEVAKSAALILPYLSLAGVSS